MKIEDKSSLEKSTSTMRSVTRGLARALISRSCGCWNTARTRTPSGNVNWRSCLLLYVFEAFF